MKKKVTILKAPKAQNGGNIEPLSSDTLLFKGDSHKDGGIPINYAGNKVEVEGGEPAFIGDDGSLNIMGNMQNPLTGRKFKADAKVIGKKEGKMETLLAKGTGLVNNSNPYDKWDVLKFNAGRAMSTGAHTKLEELKQSKEHLSILQNAMLEKANELGVDAEYFSKGLLKKGNSSENAQNGKKLSLAQRNNNPGNLKFSKWMTKYGATSADPGTDGGNFAKFPDVNSGQRAMVALLKDPKYQNKYVYDAIDTWTGGSSYAKVPSQLVGKRVKDLDGNEFNSLLNTITQGEDSKLYNWEGVNNTPNSPSTPQTGVLIPQQPYTPVSPVIPPTLGNYPNNPGRTVGTPQPFQPQLNEIPNIQAPTDASNFDYSQIVPELYAAATNQVDPVFAQKYSPDLYQPYNISLQDRRNLNSSTFRAASQRLTDNASALSTLAGQKYEADNQVNAEEFRINQGIQNDITNKNVQLLNDAEMKNLQIADTQYVRQSQAKSNTKATNQAVLNSISDKVAKHSLENKTLQVYENLYPHYRYGENYQLQKEGNRGEDYLNWGNSGVDGGINPATSTRVVKNAQGKVMRTTESTPSLIKQQQDNIKNSKSVTQMLKEGTFLFNTKTQAVTNKYNNNYSPLKGYDYSK